MRGMHSVRVTKECQVSNGLSERHPYCSNERRFSIGLERDVGRRGRPPRPSLLDRARLPDRPITAFIVGEKRPSASAVRPSVRPSRPSLPSSTPSSHRPVTPRSPLYFVSISRVSRYVRARCARLVLAAFRGCSAWHLRRSRSDSRSEVEGEDLVPIKQMGTDRKTDFSLYAKKLLTIERTILPLSNYARPA